MTIKFLENSHKVNGERNSMKDFVDIYNESVDDISIDLGNIKDSIDTYENNLYVSSLLNGLLVKIKSASISSANINGKLSVNFGKNNKNTTLLFEDNGLIIDNSLNYVSEGINNALIFSLDKNTDLYTNGIPYQKIDLNTNSLLEGQVIIIRIDDDSNIYGEIYLRLAGHEDLKTVELSPNRPSITLMKSHDDRFLILSYPIIKVESISRIDTLEESVKNHDDRITDIEEILCGDTNNIHDEIDKKISSAKDDINANIDVEVKSRKEADDVINVRLSELESRSFEVVSENLNNIIVESTDVDNKTIYSVSLSSNVAYDRIQESDIEALFA